MRPNFFVQFHYACHLPLFPASHETISVIHDKSFVNQASSIKATHKIT